MIRFATENHPAEVFPNLAFVVKDARSLEYRQEYHVVFSNAALHWIPDHQPVLHGIANALQHHGHALLQMAGLGNAADFLAALNQLIAGPKWQPHFHTFQFPYASHAPADYRLWLSLAGLQPHRVQLIPKTMTHNGPAGLAGWFRTTWRPYTHAVPEHLRKAFVDQVVSNYLRLHPPHTNGQVHLRMVRLEVHATKP